MLVIIPRTRALLMFHAYTSQQYVSQTLCQTSSNPPSATRARLSQLSSVQFNSLLLLSSSPLRGAMSWAVCATHPYPAGPDSYGMYSRGIVAL